MTGPQTTAANAKTHPVENIKETLESIVVAFVLAFVFRAFIVEAFVIPTGSMAVTLYGEQLINTCSNCGYEYARGIGQEEMYDLRNQGAGYELPLRCPNCNTQCDHFSAHQVQRPNSGDRILVHKWPFDVGGAWLKPQRWGVTVFKDPRDGTTNFIKRLVGLPGEVLEIIDGDIYTAPITLLQEKDPSVIADLERIRQWTYSQWQSHLQQRGRINYADIAEQEQQINARLLPYMTIQCKTEEAQQSLWFNVYNHDFLPGSASKVGWEPVGPEAGQAWNTKSREITFADVGVVTNSDQPLGIRFTGKPIDDYYAYNSGAAYLGGETNLVGDLRLRFVLLPETATGTLTLRMNRHEDTFVATLGMDGSVQLERINATIPGGRQLMGNGPVKVSSIVPGQAVEVQFINVDFRVSVRIDGEEVLASRTEQYAPNLIKMQENWRNNQAPLPSQVQIAGQQARFRLRHVVLERDEYYRSSDLKERHSRKNPSDPRTELVNAFFDWPGWGTFGHPIMLRPTRTVGGQTYPAEYFMLGDNSPASKDSRLWWEAGDHLRYLNGEYQLGTVPEDQLIGQAFFVYWPGGYRPSWAGGIGLVPNFGQMRWIH